MKKYACLCLLLPLAILAACDDKRADTFLGKWTGPEGTFLEVAKGDNAYTVTIQNLDGPRIFSAKSNSAGLITFERDGKTEVITAGNGDDTGMKWLAEKSDCIVIIKGEGYCRD